jgi:hypothetical protein
MTGLEIDEFWTYVGKKQNKEPFPKPLLLEDEVLERPQGGKTNNSTE